MRMKVENLHFSYGSHEVLKGVSFGVEDSGFVSLLGPNGAGKTTIINLLMRFYDVDAGAIRAAGKDIRHMPRTQVLLRRFLGYRHQ